MYAKSLHIYDFRCFGKAELNLQYPGRHDINASPISNVNVVVGDNGGGKSSVLRALAIAALAPALQHSGFVPYRLVRRPNSSRSLLKIIALLQQSEKKGFRQKKAPAELLARIERTKSDGTDRLNLDHTPLSPIMDLLDDDYSAAFFLVGYGATRRSETGDFSQSSARKTRGLRYERVASLFEDNVTIRPLQSWLPDLSASNRRRVVNQLNLVLPPSIRFHGEFDKAERQHIFEFSGRKTPFASLSDGYKAFIGWAGELVGHLCDVSKEGQRLSEIPGIVLVDEIDLHLHPEWQRQVVPTLARAFPKLQFIFTTHSPIVTSTVRKENLFVTDTADDGTATIKQIGESTFGRGVEQILLSSYFGLKSTRPESFLNEARALFQKAASGNSQAALEYLNRLAPGTQKKTSQLRKARSVTAHASKTASRRTSSK